MNIGGSEALSNLITNPNPTTVALKNSNTIDDVRIGTTTYDFNLMHLLIIDL